jgi:pantoate--beta-alanine ligase
MVPCPIIRESDGLAMSSRNLRLSESSRAQASGIYRSMLRCKERFLQGENSQIVCKEEAFLLESESGLKVEYLEICDESSLKPVHELEEKVAKPRIFIAAYAGNIRLIDNLSLEA